MREPATNARRKQLGARLRQLRKAAGLKQAEAAAATGISEATISGMETGNRRIMPRSVSQLCHLYGVGAPEVDMLMRQATESERPGWLVTHSGTVPDYASDFLEMQAQAAEIRTWSKSFVTGLLQDPDYVRNISRASRPDSTDEEIERSVVLRRARQELLDGEQPPRLAVVLDEAVLRRPIGTPAAWRAQLEHLMEMGKRPNIDIRVLPFSAGAHPGMSGQFVLLRYPDADRVSTIYLEFDNGGVYPDRPADLDRYEWIWSELQRLALTPKKTFALISRVMEDL